MRTTLLGDKIVRLAEPFQPLNADFSTFIGNEREIQTVIAAWTRTSTSDSVLCPTLIGDPGTGKTSLLIEVARILQMPIYIFQGRDDLNPDDLCGGAGIKKDSIIEYHFSPILTCASFGGVLIFDEISKCSPRSISALSSLLDFRGYMDSNLLGERIYAHPDFRMACTANTGELDFLPDFIQSRLKPVIEIKAPSRYQIDSIIRHHCTKVTQDSQTIIQWFWNLWNYKDSPLPSIRDVIYTLELAKKFAALESPKASEGTFSSITEASLQRAFELIFVQQN